jgi:alpha-maltose-1-phosphate synthase
LSQDVRVTVVSPYPFHMVDQARQLHQQGILERVVAAVPRGRLGVPGELAATRLRWSALRRAGGRAIPRADRALSHEMIRDFDRWAASRLGEPSVVNGLSGFATQTLARASARGVTVFCDRGSWHILEQQQVMDEEADRIGVPPVPFDPFMVDRELREYDLADRILVPSETARQSFVRRGMNPDQVVKVPYGVDVSAFSVPVGKRCPGAIISVAAVGLRKGHHHLMAAFRMLRTRHASLTLVGPIAPGWDRRLGLDQPRVRATGAVKRAQVIEELQRASVFVLTSIEEGLALVIAQAMACGLPVVATEATGARELITDGVEGLLVSASCEHQALAEAMDSLLSEPSRAEAMGTAARRKVESLGGWEEYGRRLAAAFRAGLDGEGNR